MAIAESGALLNIPLEKIRLVKGSLREAKTADEGFQGLVDSIKRDGVLNSILVRPMKDKDTGEEYYDLVDGTQRFTACKDLGLKTIPAKVQSMADHEVIEKQIIANVQKIETRPVEYSKALQLVLKNNPTLTKAELGERLSKSGPWVDQRLGLLDLHENIQPLVDEGKIVLTNAYALAKLEKDDQIAFLARAQSDPPNVFIPACEDRRKEVAKARRAGKDTSVVEFTPTAYLQKLAAVKDEHANSAIGPVLCQKVGLKSKEASKAFALAVAWFLHLDPDSVEIAKKKFDENQKMQAEKREAAKLAKMKRRQEKAARAAARTEVEAAAMKAGEDVEAALKAFDEANPVEPEKAEQTA